MKITHGNFFEIFLHFQFRGKSRIKKLSAINSIIYFNLTLFFSKTFLSGKITGEFRIYNVYFFCCNHSV